MISVNGKIGQIGLCINNGFQEAKELFSSSHHQYYDRSSAQKDDEQVGSRGTTDPIGY